MRDTLRAITAEDYLGDVTELDVAELRRRRAACQEVETGLSYLRRQAQGRLDVVAAERARRSEDGGDGQGDGDDLEALIARLPELLAGSTRSPGAGRLPSDLGTGDVDDDLAAELAAVAPDARLSQPDHLDDAELDALAEALVAYERKVSDLRRRLFDLIDAFEAELARRYRSGEASVDSLLS